MTKTLHDHDADSFFGASVILMAAILVPGLLAMFLTDDFWMVVATMALGAFVGLVIQAKMDKRPRG